eukprot:14479361-Ditylum_brightwellii.AAC.1
MSTFLLEHNIPARVDKLVADTKEGCTMEQYAELEALDKLITGATLMAKDAVSVKQRTWWSKDLHTAYLVTRYWKLVWSAHHTSINHNKQLNNIINKLSPDVDVFQGDKSQKPSSQLWKAVKQLRSCCNNRFQLYKKFLEDLTEEAAANNEKKKLKILKQMEHMEARNLMYSRMTCYLRPDNRSGITQVDIPEWEKLELGLSLVFSNIAPAIQWWFIIYFFTM